MNYFINELKEILTKYGMEYEEHTSYSVGRYKKVTILFFANCAEHNTIELWNLKKQKGEFQEIMKCYTIYPIGTKKYYDCLKNHIIEIMGETIKNIKELEIDNRIHSINKDFV